MSKYKWNGVYREGVFEGFYCNDWVFTDEINELSYVFEETLRDYIGTDNFSTKREKEFIEIVKDPNNRYFRPFELEDQGKEIYIIDEVIKNISKMRLRFRDEPDYKEEREFNNHMYSHVSYSIWKSNEPTIKKRREIDAKNEALRRQDEQDVINKRINNRKSLGIQGKYHDNDDILLSEQNALEHLERLVGKEIFWVNKKIFDTDTSTSQIDRFNKISKPNYYTKNGFVVKFILKETNLKGLPENFTDFEQLEKVSISRCGLKNIPDIIDNFQSLDLLDLSYNNLKELPESIGNLKSLRILDLSYNNIKSLPESFGNLTNLERLNLYSNNIKVLPETLGKLSKLQILIMGSNNLSTLPNSSSALVSLKALDISDNPLHSIPENIGNLNSLRFLDINIDKINNIPQSFMTLLNNLDMLREKGVKNTKILADLGFKYKHAPKIIDEKYGFWAKQYNQEFPWTSTYRQIYSQTEF